MNSYKIQLILIQLINQKIFQILRSKLIDKINFYYKKLIRITKKTQVEAL